MKPTIDSPIVKEKLKALPFVLWDRWIETPMGVQVYGWIDREDSYKDFVLISFERTYYWYTTSSSLKTKEISSLLGMDGKEHDTCKRIENTSWANEINCIKL